MASKEAQAAATRTELVAVARRLFAQRGYAGTSTEEIVTQAGVTRGALYYHFRSKQDLFRAVYASIEEGVNDRVTAVAMAVGEAWEGLEAACAAYLDTSLEPAVQQIALLDAPSVLGWDEWHEIGSQHRFGLLATALHWAMASGHIADQPVAPVAHVVLGALNEGAMFIARADDRMAARDQIAAVISSLLNGLQTR